MKTLCSGISLLIMLLAPWDSVSAQAASPAPASVPLPQLTDNAISPRVIYVENPRFPAVTTDELQRVLQAAASLVKAHFGISMQRPAQIPVLAIDPLFTDLVAKKPPGFDDLIGDFRHHRVNWERVRQSLTKQIESQQAPLEKQIEFARPYLVVPLEQKDLDSFSRAVVATFKSRLERWTVASHDDGYPVIGEVAGRPDLPVNEYGYWSLMAKQGIPAEIILTNQLVASVEYLPIPVHTSIRGGITGGSTEYNPASRFGSSVWVSLFPYFSDHPAMLELRGEENYTRDQALRFAGTMLAHEMGHQLLHLGHPWSNQACLMRPAEALQFKPWHDNLNATQCPLNSRPAMKPGAIQIPIW